MGGVWAECEGDEEGGERIVLDHVVEKNFLCSLFEEERGLFWV